MNYDVPPIEERNWPRCGCDLQGESRKTYVVLSQLVKVSVEQKSRMLPAHPEKAEGSWVESPGRLGVQVGLWPYAALTRTAVLSFPACFPLSLPPSFLLPFLSPSLSSSHSHYKTAALVKSCCPPTWPMYLPRGTWVK